jgi:hypothetical protein
MPARGGVKRKPEGKGDSGRGRQRNGAGDAGSAPVGTATGKSSSANGQPNNAFTPPSNSGQAAVPARQFSLSTGKELARTAQTAAPPSVIEVGLVNGSVSDATGEHQSKTWFEACQRRGRMDNEDIMMKDISTYVRYELFPKLKFVMNNKQLSYSLESTSLCNRICMDMGMVDPKMAMLWWERYKDLVADVLNAKRADVTGALKRSFLSKFMGQFLVRNTQWTNILPVCLPKRRYFTGKRQRNGSMAWRTF